MTLDETAARLEGLLERADQTPWAYRSHELDDWGMIRSTVEREGFCPIVARSHGDTEQHGLHRAKGTDPYEDNGLLITEGVNALPALLSERRALKAENERLREALAVSLFEASMGKGLGGDAKLAGWSDETRQYWIERATALTGNGGEHE